MRFATRKIDVFGQRIHYGQYSQTQVVSTAAGVLVLAAAAAAIAVRLKE